MSALPALRRRPGVETAPVRMQTIARTRLPTDPLQRIIKLVSAVEEAYAPIPAAARQPFLLPPLRNHASTPQPAYDVYRADQVASSSRTVHKSKKMMLQHLESCFESAEAAERTSIMLSETQARARLVNCYAPPRDAGPAVAPPTSPIRTRQGRIPLRHIAKTRTATAYPIRRVAVLEQVARKSLESEEAKQCDWLITVERQARTQAEDRAKLQRSVESKQYRDRDRQRCATSVVLDVLDDASTIDDLRWEVAQSVVHKSIVAAMGKDAAQAAHKAEMSSVNNRRHEIAKAIVDRLVNSIVGRRGAMPSNATRA